LQPPGNDGYLHAVITRGTPVPPWRQLAQILRGQIETGELAPGQQLPSAMQLAERYEVAVPTVRKALNLLKSEGLITGVAGYGTFVSER
jgi:DNA-binding GntR family transcriptional regulator